MLSLYVDMTTNETDNDNIKGRLTSLNSLFLVFTFLQLTTYYGPKPALFSKKGIIMKSVNKATIIGRIGAAPELNKHGDKSVCNFSVATSERWKDKQSGERRERTEWHEVSVWGGLADICFQGLAKGAKVYVEGSMKSSEWIDKDDVKRRAHYIEASEVIFLDDKDKSAAG